MPSTARVPRRAVLAHFDPDGEVAPHVRRTITAIDSAVDDLTVVSTAALTQPSRDWLAARARVIERPNEGHDFASYRVGIDAYEDAPGDLILLNDSAVFPLAPLEPMLDAMTGRADFWGITPGYGFAPHIQSSFLVFSERSRRSTAWSEFWRSMGTAAERDQVVLHGEVRLSQSLHAAGMSMSTWFRPSLRERVRGAARAHSDELRLALTEHRPRKMAGWLRRLGGRASHPEWNPAVALADASLRHPSRLPAVKISALRDDAYRLGAPSLLTALERRFPAEFSGVRAYLQRTDPAYAGRWARTLQGDSGILTYRT